MGGKYHSSEDVSLFENSGFTTKHSIDPVCWKFVNAKHEKIYDNDEDLILENVDKFWDTGGYFMEFSLLNNK
jgi:hypothetical protein